MKTNGALFPSVRICVSRSNPLITGICTSATTHEKSPRRADFRKSTGRRKGMDLVSVRTEKIIGRSTDRCIIVDN